jgi:hypothetical protein
LYGPKTEKIESADSNGEEQLKQNCHAQIAVALMENMQGNPSELSPVVMHSLFV